MGRLKLAGLPLTSGTSPPSNLRLTLEVIPFSSAEQSHAREWFSSTGSLPNANVGGESGDQVRNRGLIDLIVATSIKRNAILRVRWRLRVSQTSMP